MKAIWIFFYCVSVWGPQVGGHLGVSWVDASDACGQFYITLPLYHAVSVGKRK